MTLVTRRASTVLAVLVTALSLMTQLHAQKPKKTPKAKPASFAVVQIDEEVRVVPKQDVKQLKADIKRENKDAVAAYKDAVKEAKKNKQKTSDIEKPKDKKLVASGKISIQDHGQPFTVRNLRVKKL